MGNAITLEYMVSGTDWQLLTQGMVLLWEDVRPVKSGVNAFERGLLKGNAQNELPGYKLTNTAEDAFLNFDQYKMAQV